ncbi:hypothetical protein [Methyloradius palustris]|uniref:Uncharacterized protein n=1 Tax=Methyloradius palustris TaxID=2778876 RepID=A0A8D5G1I4_9PROT|nr:hypothetical protein [Methyloradius palustris]BCM23955.1 hypothetical protein ZMTM_02140 [Methyloradius palustris]
MSNQPTQDKNTLAQVLGKINALSQKKTAAALPVVSPLEIEKPQAAIPVLTEVYSGDIVHGYQAVEAIPVLSIYESDAESLSPEDFSSFSSNKKMREQLIKKIMAEMQPMIDSAVKEALIHELAIAEVRLLSTLEKDLNALLRLRLESLVKP